MNDYPKMRQAAIKNAGTKWYKNFCIAFDKNVTEAQRYLRTVPTVFTGLKSIASHYWEGKPGHPFSRHELFVLRNPTASIQCPVCTKPKKPWVSACSVKCAAAACVPKRVETCIRKYGASNPSRVPSIKEKRKATHQRLYGVDNAFQAAQFQNKAKETIRKTYGVENVSQSMIIKQKKTETMRKNFGYDHWSQAPHMKHKILGFTDEMLSKARKTCLERYGHDNPFKVPDIQERIRATIFDKYGVENVFQSPEIQERIKQTMTERYGVAHPMQLPEFRQKLLDTRERNGTSVPSIWFRMKRVRDHLGRYHEVQGHEPKVIESLRNFKNISKIETRTRHIPRFRYVDENGKHRRYYPDMKITTKSGDVHIIEVKSHWTLTFSLETNLCKFRKATKSCNKKSRVFWLFYVGDDGNIIRVRNPTSIQDLRSAGIDV